MNEVKQVMSEPREQFESESPDSLMTGKVYSSTWRRKLFWPLVVGTILIWLIAAVGIIWLLYQYYQMSVTVSSSPTQVTQVTVAPTIAPLAPTIAAETEPTLIPTLMPTPTLPPVPTPTATQVSSAANFLAQAREALRMTLIQRDQQQAQAALDLLTQAEALDSSVANEATQLRSQLFFALDALDGTIYLTSENTSRWSLRTSDGQSLFNPIDLTISQDSLYLIDSNTLYRSTWPITNSSELVLTPILTPATRVGGYLIKEIFAVEATNTQNTVFVLDKANDLYRYDPVGGTWYLETVAAAQFNNPEPLYLNLGSYDNRIYILDPARNQIWRYPPSDAGPGVLPGVLPWLIKTGEPDVNSGIDLAVDGSVYVLQRDGTIVVYSPTEKLRFNLTVADSFCHVPGWGDLPLQPSAIFATEEGTMLHVADPGRRRVVTFDRSNGQLIRQFVAPDNLDFSTLRSIVEKDGQLLLLAGTYLYHYDLNTGLNSPPDLAGQLPVLAVQPTPDLSPNDLLPNSPVLPALLATYNFTMPLQGAQLPDRSAIYPGSRRGYRYGVHEGLDLYGKDIGIEVQVGTPVYAAGAGQVLRADVDYQEMTLVEVNTLLDEANAKHYTSAEALEKLSGRQIWLDHGHGVVTRYAHLNAIAAGITSGQTVSAGQLIGYVGLSGTPDGINGNTQFPHLHFEIRLGSAQQYYLGQWLTIEETRRAFEHIFKVPVRPAYLEFRKTE